MPAIELQPTNRSSGETVPTGNVGRSDSESIHDSETLRRDLPPWQILMIAISGLIGVMIFGGNQDILRTIGPAGLLVTVGFVGLIAICVMEGLSEMIVQWPIPNAMVAFVRDFVDKDLALAIGIAYWYSWASIFGTMISIAAEFSSYWDLGSGWQVLAFNVGSTLIMLWLNYCGVKYYGYIEGVGGFLKLLLVLGGALFLFVEAGGEGSRFFNQGLHHDPCVAPSNGAAFCLVVPILAYGFVGVELVSVTAFEAYQPSSLRAPSRWIAWIMTTLFFLVAVGMACNVSYQDPDLPVLDERAGNQTCNKTNKPVAIITLVAERHNTSGFPGFLNACLIYVSLSAANTALYVSSRTLYGLTREIEPDASWPLSCLRRLGTTVPKTNVPGWALVVCAASFLWVPFLRLANEKSTHTLVAVMTTTGSIGCVIVWASQCLAFIRYHKWVKFHEDEIYVTYDRRRKAWHTTNASVLSYFQPVPAWIGLIGCFLIVFVFNTATWWNGLITARKVAIAYAGPCFVFVLCVALKCYDRFKNGTWTPWVELSTDYGKLQNVITRYEKSLFLRDEAEERITHSEQGQIRRILTGLLRLVREWTWKT